MRSVTKLPHPFPKLRLNLVLPEDVLVDLFIHIAVAQRRHRRTAAAGAALHRPCHQADGRL